MPAISPWYPSAPASDQSRPSASSIKILAMPRIFWTRPEARDSPKHKSPRVLSRSRESAPPIDPRAAEKSPRTGLSTPLMPSSSVSVRGKIPTANAPVPAAPCTADSRRRIVDPASARASRIALAAPPSPPPLQMRTPPMDRISPLPPTTSPPHRQATPAQCRAGSRSALPPPARRPK